MICTVLQDFIDKQTKVAYRVNELYSSNNQTRIKELIKLGYIEGKEPKKTTNKTVDLGDE